MWDCCCSSSSFKYHSLSLPFLDHNQNQLPVQAPEENHDPQHHDHHRRPLSAFTMIFTSWLRRSTSRYLILALCSPLLLPLFCATFPCLCVLEVFFRLCRRRRRRGKRRSVDGCDGSRMRQSGDGDNGEGLLQRYLEDQLTLVAGSVCELGDVDDDEVDVADTEYFDNRSPALQPGET